MCVCFHLCLLLHFSFPFLYPDHQFGPCFLLLGLVFHVCLQAGSPLDLLQGHLHLRSYRCMAVKWASLWRWLLEDEKRRFLTVLKQVGTFLLLSGVFLDLSLSIWVLILSEGLFLSDCTSEVILPVVVVFFFFYVAEVEYFSV